MFKVCKKCNKKLPLESFYMFEKVKGYRKNKCIDCEKERVKIRISKNPVVHEPGYYYKVLQARRKRILKQYGIGSGFLSRYGLKVCLAVFQKWGHKCAECGAKDDLTFHHINDQGRHFHEKKKGRMDNRPENLRVLCRACHGSHEGRKNKGIPKKVYLRWGARA